MRRGIHQGTLSSSTSRLQVLALWMLLTLLRPTATAFFTTCTTTTTRAKRAATPLLRPAKTTFLMAASVVNVYPEGQDPKELFDLYEPPLPEEVAGAKVKQLRPLGKTMIRSKVHAEGHWHRAVHIWLMDDNGGLLLQRRSKFKDTFPDRWDVSCGGHIETGQEAFPTAERELEEELGLAGPLVKKLEHLYTIAATNKGRTERHGEFTCNEYQEFFLLRVGPKHDLSLYKYPPGEVTDIKIMNYKDLEERMAAGDPEYVPRQHHYRHLLWAHLDEVLGSKK